PHQDHPAATVVDFLTAVLITNCNKRTSSLSENDLIIGATKQNGESICCVASNLKVWWHRVE
ncbi:hypothetical protein, partial [Ruegeria sp. HKCCD6604]|uniref:hypothetical protein n=1 Tax=Ruegeria sp. HKCCD6604 TaxID=2683000 RepID=UPI001C122DD8